MKASDSDAMLTQATGAIQDTGDAQPSAPVVEWDDDTNSEKQDSTAGGEFVDDQIRLE